MLVQSFYAQSPDFHKPGLCYYPKFCIFRHKVFCYGKVTFSSLHTNQTVLFPGRIDENMMAKLANVTEAISFLEEQLKSIKGKILKVEEAMEQLITASTSLYTNYSLLRSIKGIGIINAIVLLCVTDNFQRCSNPRKFACYSH